MMSNVSAKPGNLVTVTRMHTPNLALVVGWRDGAEEWGTAHGERERFVLLRFIKPARAVKAGTLAYDTRDLEVIS
jgi:hypothetical protein|tara:strand:- start:341 stop:565 length:225 start_codon:yes stop_codon:yes gene_type:complete